MAYTTTLEQHWIYCRSSPLKKDLCKSTQTFSFVIFILISTRKMYSYYVHRENSASQKSELITFN